jgi:5'-nucleotidase
MDPTGMDRADDIGLFDMDGSLADFDGALRRDLERMRAPQEPPIGADLWDDTPPHLEERMRLIRSSPGWWRSLPAIEAGFVVYRLAQELGFNNQILTKGPKRFATAWQEKLEWCQRYFGDDIDVHVVSDKRVVYGKFLYDDYPGYMLRWLRHRPRGLGIMPATEANQDFRHPNVLRWDGTNLDAVRRALTFVKARQPGEPLCPL